MIKTVGIISSKSDAHRALICAGLSGVPCEVIYKGTSRDIEATKGCMQAIREALASMRSGTGSDMPADLHPGESGSTLRFLLPVAGALGITADFHLEGRLADRPLSPLYEELASHGCVLSEQGKTPLTISGKLKGGDFTIPGNVSSQYISGLLFAAPLLKEDSRIIITGNLESSGYVDMTLSTIRRFGIEVNAEKLENTTIYEVKGNQAYVRTAPYIVEGDWSNAAFWLSAGVLGGSAVKVTGLDPDSVQGDKEIVALLRKFGAEISEDQDGVTAFPSAGRLKGITVDAGQIPDMVPALSLVAAVSEGTTEIVNAGRLRIKESDRLATVAGTLGILGASVTERPEGLLINGVPRLHGGTVSSCNDHRIAMMAAVSSLVSDGRVVIEGSDAVSKSYPDFFDVFTGLGFAGNLEAR